MGSSFYLKVNLHMANKPVKPLWQRISGPVKIGVVFGLIGVALAIVGMFRGFAPMTFRSFAMAVLISGLSWGIVSFRQAELFVLVIGAGIGTTAWLKSLGL